MKGRPAGLPIARRAYRAGRLREAERLCRRILARDQAHPAALSLWAAVARRTGRSDRALELLRRGVARSPRNVELSCDLAHALILTGRSEEAEGCARQALGLGPASARAHHVLAMALGSQGRVEKALTSNEDALRLQPRHPTAHTCRALWRLQEGDFDRGWPEYEWRWRQEAVVRRRFREPRWDGSHLDGRSILVHAEQGLGDTLQFVRYARLVRERGGTVVLECQPGLQPLLRSCPGIDYLRGRGAPLPRCDFEVPLLSLPGVLRTTLATVPADVPYLFADGALVAQWRRELGPPSTFKVGIAWQGNPMLPGDRLRSIPVAHFAPLARLDGVRVFGLQKGPGREQLRSRPFPVADLGDRLDKGTGAFMDTAAVMKCLDLVVTSDTSIAHLAGALGVPVWVALSIGADWRWLLDREDSPWYPTMRLFRQRRLHDWDEVFERMATELRETLASERVLSTGTSRPGLPRHVAGARWPSGGQSPVRPSRPVAKGWSTPAARERSTGRLHVVPRRVTVCILTYGVYLPYFRRCLDAILRNTPSRDIELRLGFNAAPASFEYARQRLRLERAVERQVLPGGVLHISRVRHGGMPVRLWHSAVNRYKEPMARLMYFSVPLATEYAVWFDDDSFVGPGWWEALCSVLDRGVDYVGQPWWVDYLPGQMEMIRVQPWYRGIPFASYSGRPGVRFMTGGFVAVRSDRLREANFPNTDRPWRGGALQQYGGDTLLGEIARQLGWREAVHDSRVQINVDLQGRHPAPRRGGAGRQFGADVDIAIR